MKVARIKMSDDPQEIAGYLVQEHGLDHALQKAIEGATAAQKRGDNYDLSVWREVKQLLRNRKAVAGPIVSRED